MLILSTTEVQKYLFKTIRINNILSLYNTGVATRVTVRTKLYTKGFNIYIGFVQSEYRLRLMTVSHKFSY
jgi:hypothetical protein